MPSTLLPHLRALLEDATRGLPEVTARKMFGCDAFFARGKIFSMVWKEGRAAVKLPEAGAFDRALALEGSEAWSPGGKMTMKHWVLLPESFNDDPAAVRPWVRLAHEDALGREAAAKKKPAARVKARSSAPRAGKKKAAPARKRKAPARR